MEPFQARPIEALLTGRARALGTPEVLSGIGKKARQGALWLALDGLEGDEQGDRPCPDWPLARAIAAMFPDDVRAPGLRDEWERVSRPALLAHDLQTAPGEGADRGLESAAERPGRVK